MAAPKVTLQPFRLGSLTFHGRDSRKELWTIWSKRPSDRAEVECTVCGKEGKEGCLNESVHSTVVIEERSHIAR